MSALPIGSNRISWKPFWLGKVGDDDSEPYRLGQIGLVGNTLQTLPCWQSRPQQPYRLGQIGLVGNLSPFLGGG